MCTRTWRIIATFAAALLVVVLLGYGPAPAGAAAGPLPAPTLLTPLDGTTNVGQLAIGTWSPVAGATGYEIELAADSQFTVDKQALQAQTATANFSSLRTSTTYYWHVRATDATTAGTWSVTRSFSTMGGTTAPTNGVIVFTSKRSGNDRIHIMNVDGSHVTNLTDVAATNLYATICPNGSRIAYVSSQGGVGGIYWMSIDGSQQTHVPGTQAGDLDPMFNSDGSVIIFVRSGIARINTDGTGFQALGPGLSPDISPDGQSIVYVRDAGGGAEIWLMDSDGTDQQQLTSHGARSWYPNFSPDGRSIVYYSNVSGNNQIYTMDLDTKVSTRVTNNKNNDCGPCFSPDGGSIIFARGFSGNRDIWRIDLATKQEQRLTDTQGSGGFDDWDPDAATGYVPAPPPDAPSLLLPINKATDQPRSITFSWNAVTGATRYEIVLAEDSLFSANVTMPTVTGTTAKADSLAPGQTYYWRVRAGNANGVSVWSETRTLAVALALTPPALLSPGNNAQRVTRPTTLKWAAAAQGTGYDVQVATDTSFRAPLAAQQTLDGLDTTQAVIDGLGDGTRYYWRVRTTYGTGTAVRTSAWSAVRVFTTLVDMPPAPALLAPADAASGVSLPVMLKWEAARNATEYFVTVAKDAAFANPVLRETSVGSLTYTRLQVSLAMGTTYYWRVRAKNAAGLGEWSAVWSFQTALGTVGLVAPMNGATVDALPVTCTWLPVSGAQEYEVQVATDQQMANLVVTGNQVSGVTTQVPNLQDAARYYWRVRAVNGTLTGAWSTIRAFATPAPAPTLTAPTDGDTGAPTAPTLTWTQVNGATEYLVQVARDTNFANMAAARIVGGATQQLTVPTLNTATKYYWRVKARGAQEGGWSAVWSFTTEAAKPLSGHPDLLLRPYAGGPYYGWCYYTPDGAQVLTQVAAPGVLTTYHLAIHNTGRKADSFTLTGIVANPNWEVTCADDAGGDITAQLMGNGWSVPLAVGEIKTFTVRVAPPAGTASGARTPLTLRAVSATNALLRDEARVVTVCGKG